MNESSQPISARLWNWWFAPFPPTLLGFCRFLLLALMCWFYLGSDYANWAILPASMRNNHVYFFDLLHLRVASHRTLFALQTIWKLSLVLACIGWLARASLIVSLVTSAYLFAVPGNFGKMGHGEGILVLTLLILALSRCGDAWSIDAVVRAAKLRDPKTARTRSQSGEYRWPIRMVWLLMSMIFLAAGITKLRISGLDWVRTDNLSNTILQHFYGNYGEPVSNLGMWIARHRELCKVIAALTICIEIGFPLALFHRVARKILVPAMFAAQSGIWVMMGIRFTQFMFAYVFFVPWDCIGASIRKRAQRFGKYTMLYDGGCGLCKSTASIVTRLDLLNRVEFIDVLHEFDIVKARFPMIDQQTALTDIHMVSPRGKILTRFAAYRETAWAIPAAWIILPLLYIPPVPQIADRIYGYVAVHRHDAGCEVSA